MKTLGFAQQEEAVLTTLTEEVLKSSEIEGEKLDKDAVRSSLARRLGMMRAPCCRQAVMSKVLSR